MHWPAVIVAVCIGLGSVSANFAAAEPRPLTPLLEEMKEIRARFGVPAVAYALIEGGGECEGVSGAFGVKDVLSDTPVDADTLFRIGSITKAFNGLLFLIAQERDILSLDEPAGMDAAGSLFTNPWEETHPLRLAHLLEHTAGFYDMSAAEFAYSDPGNPTLETALAFEPASRTVAWPPGMHSSYSNSGAGLAAYVLEHRSGKRYEDLMTQHVFAPLGMTTAGFFIDGETRSALATGYQADGRTVIPLWHMLYRPFGGIHLAPRDMLPFLRLLTGDGRHAGRRLLPAAAIRRMEEPRTTLAARAGLRKGYGLGNYAWERDGFVFHGHGGDADGYLSHFGYERTSGGAYFVVITAFDHGPLRALRRSIERWLVDGRERPPAAAPAAPDASTLHALAGEYAPVTSRFRSRPPDAGQLLHLRSDGRRLYTREGNERERALEPVSGGFFRRPGEAQASAAFVRDESGALFLQGGMGNYRRIEHAGNREP